MGKQFARCLVCLFALCLTAVGGYAAERSRLCDRVKPAPTYPGALRASEVCIRSLVPRQAGATNPYDTLRAVREFHATRLEWTYSLTAEFVAKAKAMGVSVSGAAANGNLDGIKREGPEWYKAYSALDLDGNAVEAPWMRPWPGHALWHCINNPAAREGYLAYVKSLVDLGVRDIQRDDPSMNANATNWGGCFCQYCVAGFRAYLKEHADPQQLAAAGVADLDTLDYAAYLRARHAPVGDAFARYPTDYLKRLFIDYQEQSTIAFHQWWRQELNSYAGRYVPVSSNNGMSDFGPIHRIFDFWVGELGWSQAQPDTLWEAARRARELGKAQTTTMPLRSETAETPEWIARTRQTIATNYALGMHIEAPWDTYLPIVVEAPARYFGKPGDYADLFALVRACSGLLDGYEEAAVTGGLLEDERWPASAAPVTIFGSGGRVCAFTRSLPGRPQAPVIVHLVDWSARPEPCSVSLDPDLLFAGRPLRLSLITPLPYDEAAHARASDTGDFGPLVRESVLAEGKVTTVEVPPLSPWGLLVIRPLPEAAGVWAPRFASPPPGDPLALVLTSPDPGATIRYTTDGTAPTATSPPYRTPLPLAGLRTVAARAYRGALASPVSLLAHPPAPGRTPARAAHQRRLQRRDGCLEACGLRGGRRPRGAALRGRAGRENRQRPRGATDDLP